MTQVHDKPLAESTHSPRALAVASVRYVLASVAGWTNFLFDESAQERLAKLGEGFPSSRDIKEFTDPNSAGGHSERSLLIPLIGRTYDLVKTGVWNGTLEQLDVAQAELTPLWNLLKSPYVLCGPYDDPLIKPEAAQHLLPLIDNLFARRELARNRLISLPRIALLSGLAEKTIRMTAKPERLARGRVKPDDPALFTIKDGQRTWVKADEAQRWLSLKPGFKPTTCSSEGPNLQPKTTLELSATLSSLREAAQLSPAELVARCNLPTSAVKTYEKLEEGWCDPKDVNTKQFDVPVLLQMSKVLKVRQRPTFVQAVREIFTTIEIAQANTKQRSLRNRHE